MSIFRFASTALCFSIAIAAAKVNAADRVWIQPPRPTSTQSDWYPRAIEILSGKVVEFDANQFQFLVEGDEVQTVIAAGRVLWIQSDHVSELEAEAIQLYADGQYAESLAKLPAVLQQRPPVWRQQWITMLSADAAWKSGHSKIALELVSQLDRRPLPPMVLAWLPVAWRGGAQNPEAISAAKARLSDPSPAVRLVSASWLLSSTDRTEASSVLKQLEADPRVEIAQLAEVLSWRTATPPQVIQSAPAWEATLSALPMVLQMGPTTTLIDKLRAAGQQDAANRLQWSLDLTPLHPHPTAL